MLSGEPPFTGNTAQAVVARVLTEAPRSLGAQRHTIPRHLEAAVLTALEKLPADRFASAAAFAEALKDKTYAGTVALDAPGPTAAARTRPGPAWSRLTVALAAVAVVATAAALWGWLRPIPAPPPTLLGLALRDGEALRPPPNSGGARIAISPDGGALAYLGPAEGGSRLWLRRLDLLTATPIAGTEDASSPFFSPDGRRVGFITRGRSVRIASLDGAPTVTLTDQANSTGGAWGDDGYVYFEVDSGLARIRPEGGTVEPVYTLNRESKEVGAEWPFVLPGGRGLLFRVRRAGQGPADYAVVAMKLPKGPARALTRGVFARYAPSGHLLVVTEDGKLVAIPFDADKLELTGPPVALIEGIGVRSGGFNVDLSLSETGTLVYTTGGTLGSRVPYWVSRDGSAAPVDPGWDPQGAIQNIALAPDGKALAVELQRSGKTDIWVKRLPTGPFSRITFDDTAAVRPSWSSDGREVLYVRDRTGTAVGPLFAHLADGTGLPRPLSPPSLDLGQATQSRDGRWLLTRTPGNSPGSGDILAFRAGDTAAVTLVATPATEFFPSLSPDGRWLAYASTESGTMEIYVRPFPATGTAKWQVSTAGGIEPIWAGNGRELFYISGKSEMMAAEIQPGPTFSVGEQHRLFSTAEYAGGSGIPSYAVSPDDRRFLLLREGESIQQSELVLAERWAQKLSAGSPR
jgi:serine/threonine-protein kinase